MSKATINRIEIENIKAITYAELKLAGRALTVIKGANGTGKTSILDAIASIFEGGSDPSLVTKGAKSGRVRIELSDGKLIEKQQTAKSATLKVTDEHGEPVPSPKDFVDSLASSFAFNPLDFIRSPKKDRAEFAAKYANLAFTGAEIGALKNGLNDAASVLREMVKPGDKLGLEDFDKLRKSVYERRKTANGAAAELEKTVANLRRSLPADEAGSLGVGLDDVLKTRQAELAKLDAAEKSDLLLIEGQVKKATDAARETYEKAVEAARQARDAELADIRTGEAEALEGIRKERAPERDKLQQAIGEAQGNLKRAGEIEALSAHLKQQQERMGDKAREADELDRALRALDELKKSRMDKFPVEGVEFRDGECYRDGTPFDHLNQERQLVTAIEIGFLGMGDLPFFVMDEAEHFDGVNFENVCKELEKSGAQVIMARVDQGPLRAEPQGALKL